MGRVPSKRRKKKRKRKSAREAAATLAKKQASEEEGRKKKKKKKKTKRREKNDLHVDESCLQDGTLGIRSDLNFLSVIFFFTLPLFLLPPSTSRRIRSVFFSFPPLPPSLSPPSSPPLPLLIAIFKRHWAHCFCSF